MAIDANSKALSLSSTLGGGFNRARFMNSLIGVLAAGVFFLFAASQAIHLANLFGPEGSEAWDSRFFADVASSLSKFLFFSLMMVLFVIRKQPIKKAKGLLPQITALAGTFMFASVAILPSNEPTLAQSVAGLSLVCVGSLLSIYVINFLGRSFSLMAEARSLVTHGPYALVRHPLYLVEEIAILGLVVQFFSLPALALFVVHVAVQLKRMKNEEKILTEAFPDDYALYRRNTPRLIPGLY